MRPRLSIGAFLVGGAVLTLALVFFVGPRASDQPDGLERVARDQGLDDAARGHALADLPTAGYQVGGGHDAGLSMGLAGVLGVVVTFVLAIGVAFAVRRRSVDEGPGPAGT